MKCRSGESERHWYRCERFFNTNDGWYFSTREGQNVGPFVSRRAAEKGVELFVRHLRGQEEGGIYGAKLAKDGLWMSTLFR